MDKFIITGASGFIGQNFLEALSGSKVTGIYFQNPPTLPRPINHEYIRVDVTRPITHSRLIKNRSQTVIHLAAYAHINKCEVERQLGEESLAWKTNVEGTKNIIVFCKKHKKRLVFISTECVFSGKKRKYSETDEKDPKNWYGITKSAAEDLIINSGLKNYLIIRSVVAYGQSGIGSSIVQNIVSNLTQKKRVLAVNDQNITFTYIGDIVAGTLALIKNGSSGIFHISGPKAITPYEFVKKVCKQLRIPTKNVIPVSKEKYFGQQLAKLRPKNLALDSSYFYKTTGIKTTNIDEGLKKVFSNV